MNHCLRTSLNNTYTRVRFLTNLFIFVFALYCYGLATPAQAANGLPNSDSGKHGSDLIPQGIARPCQRATMSAPLQGMLVEVLVKGGEQVKKGQILAVMDNKIAKASVEATRVAADCKAQIDYARHALALSRSLLARHTALKELQAGAEFELEQARAQRDQAEATLASAMESQLQAKKKLELEEARLEVHNIRAPFDGQVVRIDATVGTTLSPANKLLTIVCMDKLEAKLHLPLKMFGKLQPGKSYKLWAFAPVNRMIEARLAFVSPVIDPASKTFRCLFTVDNHDRQLPAGFGVCFDSSDTKASPIQKHLKKAYNERIWPKKSSK